MRRAAYRHLHERDRVWAQAADGLRYVLLATDPNDPERPLSVMSDYPPDHQVPPHTHGTDYIEIVISGELTVGKTRFVSGDARIMKAGTGYGPLRSGPLGCRVLTVFDRSAGSAPIWLGRDEHPA